MVCQWHLQAHTIMELRAKTIEKLFSRLDAYRNPKYLEKFVQACQADATGRWGEQFQQYPQADYIRKLFKAARKIDKQPLFEQGLQGKALGEQIRQLRIRAIQSTRQYLTTTE